MEVLLQKQNARNAAAVKIAAEKEKEEFMKVSG